MTITKSDQETHDFAMNFANTLPSVAIIALEGELGAGKTCFVRGLCEGLGGDPRQVNSPTFTIMQEYHIAEGKRLVHIDAYRLAYEDDLEEKEDEDFSMDADEDAGNDEETTTDDDKNDSADNEISTD